MKMAESHSMCLCHIIDNLGIVLGLIGFLEDTLDPVYIPYVGMFMSLFVAPVLVFGFIILLRRSKNEVEKLRYKKEILELELKKEALHFKHLHEENKKYDRIIDSEIRTSIENK